jgi:hypothetical protein
MRFKIFEQDMEEKAYDSDDDIGRFEEEQKLQRYIVQT